MFAKKIMQNYLNANIINAKSLSVSFALLVQFIAANPTENNKNWIMKDLSAHQMKKLENSA